MFTGRKPARSRSIAADRSGTLNVRWRTALPCRDGTGEEVALSVAQFEQFDAHAAVAVVATKTWHGRKPMAVPRR
jgi:hypothetical protein